MQIQNNPQITSTPNFKAIKSIKSAGLYKNQPRLVQGLVETFQTNKTAMDFYVNGCTAPMGRFNYLYKE